MQVLNYLKKLSKIQIALAVIAGLFVILSTFIFTIRIALELRSADGELETQRSAGSIFMQIFSRADEGSDGEFAVVASESIQIAPLSGLEISADIDLQPVAVMIENHGVSRPQMMGLVEAPLVYEALAEGGITRFMAVFDSTDISRVGPVRSARPYFVDWASEIGGGYVHAGGSNAALRQITTAPILDFDEDGTLLFRDFRYLKPHNLFANVAALRNFLTTKNWRSDLLEPRFDFSGELPERATLADGVSLDFSFPSYFVEYAYNESDGKYDRYLAGVLHRDATGRQIRPDNLIIQFTKYWVIDEEGRLELESRGVGEAWYFSKGLHWKGLWERGETGQTVFTNADGTPIALNPGQTWIAIIEAGDATITPSAE